MELPLQSLPQANYQGNTLYKGVAQIDVKFVSETSQSSCFKLLYESSKRLALFVEDRNEKLQSELWENHAKSVSVEKQPPGVFYKKSWS